MRLVDADEAYKVLTDYYNHKTEIQHKALKEAIGRVPSIDAVEVVRCKDCKWRGELGCAVSIVDESDIPDDDDYCSWGERREDDNTETIRTLVEGHWIKDKGIYKCTACNSLCTVAGWADCIPEKQMYKVFRFCPNCGARMDEVEDETG